MSIHNDLELIKNVAMFKAEDHNCNYNIVLKNPGENNEFILGQSSYEMVQDSYFDKPRPYDIILHKTDDLKNATILVVPDNVTPLAEAIANNLSKDGINVVEVRKVSSVRKGMVAVLGNGPSVMAQRMSVILEEQRNSPTHNENDFVPTIDVVTLNNYDLRPKPQKQFITKPSKEHYKRQNGKHRKF